METILYCDNDTERIKAVIASLSQEYCVLCSTSLGELRRNFESRNPALVLLGCSGDSESTRAIAKNFRQFAKRSERQGSSSWKRRECRLAILDYSTDRSDEGRPESLYLEDGEKIYLVWHSECVEVFLGRIASVLRFHDDDGQRGGVFIGRSHAIRRVYKLIETYADAKLPVLILGETGTGKELTAKALHALSARKSEPFIAKNCASIPDNLIESELFGTEKGAFTDAIKRRGAFAMAERGTLFLDEIGSLSLIAQPHLLRVLETGEYWKLGGECLQKADFRLISASSQSPIALAENEKFRPDLLYRIANLLIEIPPLRERKEDIEPLVRHFCSEMAGKRIDISEGALDKLYSYHWPGNVRELKATVTRAAIDCACLKIGPDDIRFLHVKPECCR